MNEQRIRDSFSKQSFLKTIGAELESVEKGRVCVSCELRDDLKQHTGVMHAGVICTIADVACGYAAMSVAGEDSTALSTEFKVNLLRPMQGKKAIATATVIKPGKTITITEAEVIDADSGKLVAKMIGTMINVKGE